MLGGWVLRQDPAIPEPEVPGTPLRPESRRKRLRDGRVVSESRRTSARISPQARRLIASSCRMPPRRPRRDAAVTITAAW